MYRILNSMGTLLEGIEVAAPEASATVASK